MTSLPLPAVYGGTRDALNILTCWIPSGSKDTKLQSFCFWSSCSLYICVRTYMHACVCLSVFYVCVIYVHVQTFICLSTDLQLSLCTWGGQRTPLGFYVYFLSHLSQGLSFVIGWCLSQACRSSVSAFCLIGTLGLQVCTVPPNTSRALEIPTPILTLARKVLYTLSHLPSPTDLILYAF